jgi:hypothetical protein
VPVDKASPTYVIPDTHRPEEFLTDAKLAVYYRELYEALPDDDPGKAAAKTRAALAKKSAGYTEYLVAEADEAAADEIKKNK